MIGSKVLAQREEQALLKAYIAEWRKFFTQCNYLPTPFRQLETQRQLQGKSGGVGGGVGGGGGSGSGTAPSTAATGKKALPDESIVRKLMLDCWNECIFSNIKHRLQESAMKLVHAERLGEAFDSQLVIGVRESYVNLCSNAEDRMQIYRDNFEAAYVQATEAFYRLKAPQYLQV